MKYNRSSPSRMRFQERCQDLLATRVIMLEQFLEEENQVAKRNTTTSKRIPVLLKPGESTHMYEEEFEDWLCRRDVKLDKLYPRPEVERRFRLDFADSRAWELRRQSVARQALRGGTSNTAIRSREELLNMEEMTPDEFWKAMNHFGPNGPMMYREKLRPIPVVLRPNEPRRCYQADFERWLQTKEVNLNLLENDPEEERRYRQAFAYARVKEHVLRKRLGINPPVPRQRQRYRARSRSWERQSSRQDRKRSESSEHHRRGIAEESWSDSDRNQKRPRSDAETTSPFDNDNEMETEDRVLMNQENDAIDCSSEQEMKLQTVNLDDSSSSPSTSSCSSDTPQSDLCSDQPKSSVDSNNDIVSFSENTTSMVLTGQHHEKEMTRVEPVDASAKAFVLQLKAAASLFNDPDDGKNMLSLEMKQQRSRSTILDATEILTRVKRVVYDPTLKLLVDEYTRVTERVVLNETAMTDFQAYGLEQSEADMTEAQHEVEEMVKSINKEKKRRDAGLSALLAHEWRGKHQQFMNFVLESQGVEMPPASYQDLSVAYGKLVNNNRIVESLQTKVNGLLYAGDLSQDETTEALVELSGKLNEALSMRTQLKTECESLCVGMLLSNDTIWTLVNTLMTEDKETLAS